MNNTWITDHVSLIIIITTVYFRPVLRSWRKKLRQNVLLVQRSRSRGLISPGNLRRSARGLKKQVVPLLPRLRWTKSVRLSSRNYYAWSGGVHLAARSDVCSTPQEAGRHCGRAGRTDRQPPEKSEKRVNTKWRLMTCQAIWRLLPNQRHENCFS